MFDFFDAFFQSDLAKNHPVGIVGTLVFSLLIGGFFMWLYMTKIHNVSLSNKNVALEKENTALKQDLNRVRNEYADLMKRHHHLVQTSNRLAFEDEQYVERHVEVTDAALDEFEK